MTCDTNTANVWNMDEVQEEFLLHLQEKDSQLEERDKTIADLRLQIEKKDELIKNLSREIDKCKSVLQQTTRVDETDTQCEPGSDT